MTDIQTSKNTTDPSQLKKSFEDLANTSNPITLFFKIWGLLGVINDELTQVSKEIS
jgi:hypothetical protein